MKSIITFFALAALTAGIVNALPYEPTIEQDKFKGVTTSYVAYDITSQATKDFFKKLRSIDCASNFQQVMYAFKVTKASGESGKALYFRVFQNITDDNKKGSFNKFSDDSQIIFLIDGKATNPGKVLNSSNESSRDQCSEPLGISHFTSYDGSAYFAIPFDLDAFASADTVEFKIYATGGNYSGVVPQDVRQNLVRLWKEAN